MLRVVAHKSAGAARQYYTEGLKREDYYAQGQEVAGKWFGRAAKMLGLDGGVTPEAFAALVENRHPGTGAKLTPRVDAGRIVGYDINFHAPKSLSVLQALTGDQDLVKAFRESVAETMTEMEQQAATRIRKSGASADRVTGNLAWAEFVHFTARPVGGIPDPHLHVHCFVFNATFDREENRWKAAKFHDIKKDAPYSEAVFHARLTSKLAALGYGIQRTRTGWEISGISRAVIDKFSRRTAQIERLAAAKGIESAKAKDAIGAASREGKRRGLTSVDLQAAWNVRLTAEEKAAIQKVHAGRLGPLKDGAAPGKVVTAREAFDYAYAKLFAKHSVVEQNRLIAEALRFGVGQVTPEMMRREFGKHGMIVRQIGREQLCTSLEILAEEVSLINFARTGRGQCAPLGNPRYQFSDSSLSAEKKAAVRHILTSRDQVIAIRGLAGVGKTTMMKEAATAIEQTGIKIFAFAPSADASRGTLRDEGFANANTVAHLLSSPKLQMETRGQVIWIDEAGLLGAREMWAIMRIAGHSTRVILTGDSGQHSPVPRGDSFRLLQKYAGLKIAELREIWRQKPEVYKLAVAALSKGELRTAFQRLEELDAFIEIPAAAERYHRLAQDYLRLSRKDYAPLVVSPTHAEGAEVTAAIRLAKRTAGQLGPDRKFIRLHNLQWEDADRSHAANYRDGLVVQFHQNAKGIRRGELFHVVKQEENGAIQIRSPAGHETTLPLHSAKHFQVFEEREINLARGDRIRITRNGDSANERRLNNGDVFTIEKFNRQGQIVLSNGAVLHADHGHLTHGFCSTSHASQSKSVRDVLVAQSESSFRAGSSEQFYVSVSRGKESIRIYTDSRAGLQEAVGNSSTRRSGLELMEFNQREVSGLMSKEMNGTQWRDAIRSRRAEGLSKMYVKNVLKERRLDALKKAESMDWRQYIEMRRALAGAGGKSRSKGHPTMKGKLQNKQNRSRSFIRPTSPKTPIVEAKPKVKQPTPEKKPAVADKRQARLEKGRLAAVKRFKERIGAKLKKTDVQKARAVKPKPSGVKQSAKHAVKQQKAQAAKKAVQKTVKARQAPPPTIKRGK